MQIKLVICGFLNPKRYGSHRDPRNDDSRNNENLMRVDSWSKAARLRCRFSGVLMLPDITYFIRHDVELVLALAIGEESLGF